jgi:hypothetical protein
VTTAGDCRNCGGTPAAVFMAAITLLAAVVFTAVTF